MKLKHHKRVAVTATTGIASTQLGFEATTLHHWSGILDGRYIIDQMKELYDHDDRFATAKLRIEQTECLMIDEISMLSRKILELLESVCRHVRRNENMFGGIQVIVCDFKQLPAVPNHRLQDDGCYCLESDVFKNEFVHHINLTKVIRQNEADLIKAVHELCDGSPSEETVALLKSLDRPLPDNTKITSLYGTNFDVNFINHEKLEDLAGEEFVFKAKDEGPQNLLASTNAAKTLVLKVGSPIILIRNTSEGLFNGARGMVHSLKKRQSPVININGKIITIPTYKFDVFDMQKTKVLASRMQYPIMLAFAMTVHRAQGQTLQYVDVDCYSFFAAGQMGVAVGRVETKAEPLDDLSCCKTNTTTKQSSIVLPSTSDFIDDIPEDSDNENDDEIDLDLPTLQNPYEIQDFLSANENSSFLSVVSADFYTTPAFLSHVNFLYFKVNELTLNPFTKSTTQQWNSTYADLNTFLTSNEHSRSCQKLFKVHNLNKQQNKLSTKLMFWLFDKHVEMKAKIIVSSQLELMETREKQPVKHSSAGEAKIHYLAGACCNKISSRLRNSVLRKIGQTSKKSKIARSLDYKKHAMLKIFRIEESEAPHNSSMSEIENKQGASRGLTIVNDDVFNFFIKLNAVVQHNCTFEHFHIHAHKTFHFCRNSIDSDIELLDCWINLFGEIVDDNVEHEIFLVLIMELFKDITEHFVRIAFVDALKSFKASVPRKKTSSQK
ncbi:PIF1 [Mytilus coruscus]|uniref:ATP-dependent DNA helicase n=1 Tax=Mytilus coruscus TaxID=42192 RepID=A0A6J8EV86_MYTCO|nr:PIF1 [Mytilus coruscus]